MSDDDDDDGDDDGGGNDGGDDGGDGDGEDAEADKNQSDTKPYVQEDDNQSEYWLFSDTLARHTRIFIL